MCSSELMNYPKFLILSQIHSKKALNNSHYYLIINNVLINNAGLREIWVKFLILDLLIK